MAEGRSMAAWSHTSAVLALVANVNRASKGPAMKPADFNPHVAGRHRPAAVPAERWWDMVVAEGKRRHPGPAA
jgi:hypothetical protein